MFQTFIYQPLYNLLVSLFELIPGLDLGLYIIIFTLIIKFILLPLSLKAIRAQKSLKAVEPEMMALRQKY